MSGPWADQGRDVLPYEVKRLIFDHVDLLSLKQLRLVSKSWATVGAEALLIPTFSVKSYSVDFDRLSKIGQSPAILRHAAATINTIVFQSLDWDPVILRKIFTSRHEARVLWETVDFVPTLPEQEALDELDAMIIQRGNDELFRRYYQDSMVRHLGFLPRVNTVEILCRNLFKCRLLRKVFDEYSLETYLKTYDGASIQFCEILGSAQRAGLKIQHFKHDQLLAKLFDGLRAQPRRDLTFLLQNLESLHLTISDVLEVFAFSPTATTALRNILDSLPKLQTLFLKFEGLLPPNLGFLPKTTLPNLHTISLVNVSLDLEIFFSLFERHADTLRRIRLSSVDISFGHGSLSNFLAKLKENVGPKVEKFQLSSLLQSYENNEAWFLKPIYNDDWTDASNVKGPFPTGDRWRKNVEDYILRNGPWPIEEADNISHLIN